MRTEIPPPVAAERRWQRIAGRLLKSFARLVLDIFFREIEVAGVDRIPRDQPLVLVANHGNGLVDAALMMGYMPVRPRFLGKSTLWRIAPLRPLLDLAGVIPVYRRQDTGVDTRRNVETFARSHELLARGGALALFPEGISHDEPALQPLKTGAARIVLEAELRFGPLDVRIVPVGLVFEARGTFRSRALVQIGDPIDPAPQLARYRQDAHGAEPTARQRVAVRELTARIDAGLAGVTLNYESWEQARLIARAVELYSGERGGAAAAEGLAATVEIRQAFVAGYEVMRARHPDRIEALAADLEEYDTLLSTAGLQDSQVQQQRRLPSLMILLLGHLLVLLLRFPPAALGTLLNWIPYRLVGRFASRKSVDIQATFKVFGALAVFPLFWLLEALLAGWSAHRWLVPGSGVPVGLAVALIAPLSGRLALSYYEIRRRLRDEAKAFLLLRTRRALAADLRTQRAAVFGDLKELIDLYRGT